MAGLSASGIGSGLDIKGIVSQLMDIERQPLTKLQGRISTYDSQLSAYGQLKSTLDSFETSMSTLSAVKHFEIFSASSTNSDALSATTNEYASAGSYQVKVLGLAENHKMGSASGLTSSSTFGGTAGNKLDISYGASSTFSIDLSSAKSLSQIKDAINSASDNPGVKATIINGTGTEQRLVLTSEESGYDNRITVDESNIGGTALGLSTLNDGYTASPDNLSSILDAQLEVDGMAISRSTNSIDDVIQGVTLKLTDTTEDTSNPGTYNSLTLDVSRDDSAVIDAVNSFIKAYNTAMSKLDSLHKDGGDLEGDNTVLSIQSQLRGTLNSSVSTSGTFGYLAELGITTNTKTGELELDEDKLKSAMDTDFDSVANVFGKEDEGIAAKLQKAAYDLTTYDGLLDTRKKGVQERIDSLTNQQDNMEYRLELIQERYQKQYSGLDTSLANMQSMSSYLTAQLSGLLY